MENTKAFTEGYQAQRAGKRFFDNPYTGKGDKFEREFKDWHEGFTAAFWQHELY
jgi:hypothetical protein